MVAGVVGCSETDGFADVTVAPGAVLAVPTVSVALDGADSVVAGVSGPVAVADPLPE